MVLSAAGLTYNTAPLPLRERAAVADAALPAALAQILTAAGVEEAFVLSTCNRTEIYAVAASRGAAADAFTAFAHGKGIRPHELVGTLMIVSEREAALHAIRVASGLESMVVGEPQVLAQIRRAHEAARRYGSTGPVLTRLVETAIAAGRRVRRTTALARHALSIPRAAASLAGRVAGSLRGRTVVVVGAGEIAALAAKAFAAEGARIAAVCNRTLETARLLAGRYDADALPLGDLRAAMRGADVVVVAVSGDETLFSVDTFSSALWPSGTRLVVDLSVPRAVAADVGSLPGIRLLTLDDFSGTGLSAPPAADLAAAEAIARHALEAFQRWRMSRAAAPVIAALTNRTAQIAEQEMRRARARLSGLDEQQRDAVRAVVLAAMRKLLHTPMVRLHESATMGTAFLSMTEDLFGLGEEIRDEGVE